MVEIIDPSTALAKSAEAFKKVEVSRGAHAVAVDRAARILDMVPADHPLAADAVALVRGRHEEMQHMTRVAELRKTQAELTIRAAIALGELDAGSRRK